MISQRNHEGYHDPTAAQAIRRVYRRKRTGVKVSRLTYRIGELPALYQAERRMMKACKT